MLKRIQHSLTNRTLSNSKLTSGHFQLELATRSLDYKLTVSSKRRTLSLEVKQGQVTIKAPGSLSHSQVEAFLLQKQSWLAQKLELHASMPKQKMHFQDGDEFLLLGKPHRFNIEIGSQFRWSLDQEPARLTFVVPSRVTDTTKYVRTRFRQFMLEQCQEFVLDRIDALSEKTRLKPTAIEFKFYKSRWGCCYHNGIIRINPWLMAAPERIIECVLIHELCHLQHLNHSASFWRLNREYCGNCDETEIWLRHNGHLAMPG